MFRREARITKLSTTVQTRYFSIISSPLFLCMRGNGLIICFLLTCDFVLKNQTVKNNIDLLCHFRQLQLAIFVLIENLQL